MHHRMAQAFVDPDDSEPEMTPAEEAEALRTDWEEDAKGEDKLCGHRFHDAIFALADAWTETTESQE